MEPCTSPKEHSFLACPSAQNPLPKLESSANQSTAFPENIPVTKIPVPLSQHSGQQHTMNSHEQPNSTVNETALEDRHARLP